MCDDDNDINARRTFNFSLLTCILLNILVHLHGSVKPSIGAILLGSIAMENPVSQDTFLVVLNAIIASELELRGVGVGLVKAHYKLCSFNHIQGALVSWI